MRYCSYCVSKLEDTQPGSPCPVCGNREGTGTPAQTLPQQLPPGTVLMNRYLVGRVLGSGGFGITYLGRDLLLDVQVAVKEYFPQQWVSRNSSISLSVEHSLGADNSVFQASRERFLQEARTMAQLGWLPNVVQVRDYFEANGTAYIVMDYVDGITLRALAEQQGGPIPLGSLLPLLEPLFQNIQAIHNMGLIHRDISPDNLMAEKQGGIRLLDFGCARETVQEDVTLTIQLRHGFAPLEQYQSSGNVQGPWTDVYSLAATIYYCITGQRPLPAMDRLFQDKLLPPSQLGADIAPGQEAALMKALQIHPHGRFQTMEDFYKALYTPEAPAEMDAADAEPPVPSEALSPAADSAASGSLTGSDCLQPQPLQQPQPQPQPQETPAEPASAPQQGLPRKAILGLLTATLLVALLMVPIIASLLQSQPLPPSGLPEEPLEETSEGTHQDLSAGAGSASAAPLADRTGMADSIEALQALQQDSTVSHVSLQPGADLTLDADCSLTLSKPTVIPIGSRLTVRGILTVLSELQVQGTLNPIAGQICVDGPEAAVRIFGSLNDGHSGCGSRIRTRRGGCVLLEGGEADLGEILLWLASPEDTNLPAGASCLVLDEDAVLQNAVRVSDVQALGDAARNPEVSGIVVEGDVELTEGISAGVPVLVSEGARITGTAGSYLYCLGGLVNYGALEGPYKILLEGMAVNCGSGSIAVQDFPVQPGSRILNCGSITRQLGDWQEIELWNYGSLLYVPGIPGIDLATRLFRSHIYHWNGEITTLEDSWLELDCESSLEIHGAFRHAGTLQNNGLLHLEEWSISELSGPIQGSTGITYLEGTLVPGADARIQGGAVLVPEALRPALDQVSLSGTAVISAFSWNYPDFLAVSSAEQLRAEEASPGQALNLSHSVSLEGDLELCRPLLIDPGVVLRVSGTLTISQNAPVWNWGTIQAGSLVLRDGASLQLGESPFHTQPGETPAPVPAESLVLLQPGGTLSVSSGAFLTGTGAINLHQSSLFLDSGSLVCPGGISACQDIQLTGSSYLSAAGVAYEGTPFDISCQDTSSLVLRDSPVHGACSIGLTSALYLQGHVSLADAQLVNSGTLEISPTTLDTDGHTFLRNHHLMHLDLSSAPSDCIFCGVLENSSYLSVSGSLTLAAGSTLRSWDTLEMLWGSLRIDGTLDNQGTISAPESVSITGPVQGNPPLFH